MNVEKFIVPEGTETLTILQGAPATPLPLKEPKSISLSGDIKAISSYVAIRRNEAQGIQALNVKTIIVEVDKNARTIVMKQDPESHYSTTITASLQESKELEQFFINTDKRFDRKALLKLLKFKRTYFDNLQQYNEVVAGLVKIRMKTSAELTQEADNKGSRVNNDESHTVAHEGFKDKFTISVPLFRGFSPVKVEVEICWEVLNSNVSFWLESVGLQDSIDNSIDSIFEAELDNVRDFVIIHK